MTHDDGKRSNARITVIGGGISGLAAAHRVGEIDKTLDVTVLEAGDQLGGVLQTREQDGYCIELGPDSMLTQVP